ncbi:MAG: proton-conducting transporter membrane subunit [Burkholderiaceae bacterium]|nr:proton-conducting transporter membrane subunit [Burkholderiaceae bacterium]
MAVTHHIDSSTNSLGWHGRLAFMAVPMALLCALVWLLWRFGLPLQWSAMWVPALNVEFSFFVDGLSALMLLMITGVGSAVFVYAGGYLAGHPQQHRLYVLLCLFMVAMIGCVTADNLIVLFLFWEMTSLTSFMLVGFNHDQAESRKSAQQALLVTGTGGLVLLAGFIVLGQAMGSFSMSEIVLRLPETDQSPQLTLALVLILVGAFTKSAQFPFHFWLPNAMSAPTPVSAYLHSATMVKLGVFLLARLDPGFGDWALWEWSLKIVGSVTAAWGMALALRERDLKRILAWSTVATLGTLVVLVGLRGEGATVAVGAMLLAHALYKAPLFFVAGNVDHGTGTRVIDNLGGLRRSMPWTAAVALLAGMSMAGMPLSFGYIAKDLILEAKSSGDMFAFADAAYTVFGAIAVAVAGVAAIRIFWRPRLESLPPADVHEGGPLLIGPPLALAIIGIVLGVFPFLIQGLIADASLAMTPGTQAKVLSLALDIGPALNSLLVTLTIGTLIYLFWDPLHRVFERMSGSIGHFGMVSVYDHFLRGIPRLSAFATRWVQGGRLPGYVLLTVSTLSLAMLALQLAGFGQWHWPDWQTPSVGFVGACVLITVGALLACVVRDRLVLLLATGLVGYGCGVLFLFTGAPDVAYTQFVVETVFVIVVASVLIRLKRKGLGKSLPEPGVRTLHLMVALLSASVLTTLLLLASATPLDLSLTEFFSGRSVPEAFGRNVVNVILVDFRALDTLGEITVVMLSLLAAWPLLQVLRARLPSASKGGVR